MQTTAESDVSITNVKLTFFRLAAAQFRAITSVPSLRWGVALVFFASAIIGIIIGAIAKSSELSDGWFITISRAFSLTLIPVQLFSLSLGADAIAGEHARGTLRATLSVIPRRFLLFGAKIAAYCATAALVGFGAGIISCGVTVLIVASTAHGITVSVTQAGVFGTLGLATGAAVLTLLVLAVGTVARQKTTAIVGALGALYLLPIFLAVIPQAAIREVLSFIFPRTAFESLISIVADEHPSLLQPSLAAQSMPLWVAFSILAGWCLLCVPWAIRNFLHSDISSSSQKKSESFRQVSSERRDKIFPQKRQNTRVGRFRSEIRKIRTLPITLWVFGLSVLLESTFAINRAASDSPADVSTPPNLEFGLKIEYAYAITDGAVGIALLMSALFAVYIAGEFQTGTAITTFTTTPQRGQVAQTKILVTLCFSAGISLIALMTAAILALLVYTSRGFPVSADLMTIGAGTIAKATVFLVLSAMLSAGIAAIVRRVTPAIILMCILLILAPAVFNTIGGFSQKLDNPNVFLILLGNFARFFPGEATTIFYVSDGFDTLQTDEHGLLMSLPPILSFTILAVWSLTGVGVWFITERFRPIRTE